MNYFLDTEFSKLPWEEGSHLISFALVSEDNREYSICLSNINIKDVSEFVLKNVIPYLPPKSERKSVDEIVNDVEKFIGKDNNPIFWAIFPNKGFLSKVGVREDLVDKYYDDYADYDFQLFKNLWEKEKYPSNWPVICNNLTDLIKSLPKENLPTNVELHNPLSDARWDFEVWKMSR